MKKVISLFERVLLSPVYFLLFSIYFVVRMYDVNIYEVPFQDFLRPLLISMLVGLILYLLFGLMVARKWHAAALMTSTWLFAFYLYGTFWPLADSAKIVRQPEVFAAIWGIFFIILIAWLGWKTSKSLNPNIPAGVNLMAIVLLFYPTIGSLVYFVSFQIPFSSQTDHTLRDNPMESSPDIYYIILDAYTRADVLAEEFGHDNEPFIQSLRDLGFYVADCSQSNYEMTPLSLTSSLNLDYIQNMSDTFTPDQVESMGLVKLLDNNNVQETVSNFGYKTIAFSSGFLMAEWRDADVFISPPYGPITEFETLLMLSSYLRILDDMEIVDFDNISAERFRTRTRLVLDSFDHLVNIPGPKFVFIHLIIPHEPFAFDAMGNPISPDPTFPRHGYSDQVKFINRAILPKLEKLIEESSSPPVIILQGDHGSWIPSDHSTQLKILNAYYLPNGSEPLYPSISPVNSFRVVFNEYFGASFPLLEDKSYHSTRFKMFEFTLEPNTCPQ
jgi:hypothetical protein